MSILTGITSDQHLVKHVAERFLTPWGVRQVVDALCEYLWDFKLSVPAIEFHTRRLCIAYRSGICDSQSLTDHLHAYFVPTVDVVRA
jgi:hypothetical protein